MTCIVLLLLAVTLLPQEISHDTEVRVTHNADPEYTPEALEAKLVGDVVLSVVVDAEGNPTEIKITKGLGKGWMRKRWNACRNGVLNPPHTTASLCL